MLPATLLEHLDVEATADAVVSRGYRPGRNAEKQRAVRAVRQLRKELGHDHGTVKRVADQLGIGVESVRQWVKQAEIDDGHKPGTTSAEAAELKALRQEVRELRRANAILKSAASFFARELDPPPSR